VTDHISETARAPDEPTSAGDQISRREKTFVQLLSEPVTLHTIQDILAYDVNRPLGGASTIDMADSALEGGFISRQQYEELKRSTEEAGDNLGRLMVERGLITAEQLSEAIEFHDRTGQPMWRTFMQLKMAVPEDVRRLLMTDVSLSFAPRPDTPFCLFLLDCKAMTDDQLAGAWKQALDARMEFADYITANGLVDDTIVARGLAAELDLPYESLDSVDSVPPALLRLIPLPIIARFRALPFKTEDDRLFVAFASARSLDNINKLGLMLQMTMQPVICPTTRLDSLLAKLIPDDVTQLMHSVEGGGQHSDRVRPGVEMLTVILRGLIKCQGTDIHIEPEKESTRVRYRVDGLLHDFLTLSPEISRQVVARLKGLAGMDVEQRFLPQDGHLRISIDDADRNFRIASIATSFGEKVAIRLVQSDIAFSTFDQLGMGLHQRRAMTNLLALPSGLVLTAGPVGSGKTTTLYACLNSMDCFSHNIMSIEDPVEFEVAGISQVQVNIKRNLTFAAGIRALLRQDPDMIMVGEIRDEETAAVAIRAALSGTLILSTIHANSATAAVSALLQLGIRPYMVGNSVAGVVFQRLVRQVCSECQEEFPADLADKEAIGIPPEAELTLRRGAGCKHCLQTGYHGRVGVFEILPVNDQFRRVIYTNPSTTELQSAALAGGMLPLANHVRELVHTGITTPQELLRVL
jgi:type IV pilus assembly protein PilB